MIQIIPAIDIIDGKCVRLTQGDYSRKTVYNEDPVEIAKMFEDHGIKRLHTVDLDGAKSSHVINYKTIERIATATNLTIDFGGGIESNSDIEIAFSSGAKLVTIGSIAVKRPELMIVWISNYGCERLILGADVKNGLISINGWKEEGNDELMPFIEKYIEHGINNVLCTDIARDGMLKGPSTDMYKKIMSSFPTLNLIASGGVSSVEDIYELNNAGIPSVVFGKAVYEGRITMKELSEFV
ncbi:MAG: 1-(5-phosphoribosyl)-5-[Bacteroidaceae bacterium]|nr:1-(5-phosphoribosyl)-5-[(5-phosphoribosylamino)methylideneamino]imidazole-4-carboxamide isomerase [Bacteroidaceae bacterium]